MKSWWPWKKKPLLTLFSRRVPWPHETPESRAQLLPPLDPRSDKPHPRNAPGGFYVVNQECMACGFPHALAPELMEWETDSEGRPGHCFFRKQPETVLDLVHAVKAVAGSCCGALRYCGSDPEALERLREAGCGDAIDKR